MNKYKIKITYNNGTLSFDINTKDNIKEVLDCYNTALKSETITLESQKEKMVIINCKNINVIEIEDISKGEE